MTGQEAEELLNAAIERFWKETQGRYPEYLLVPLDVYDAYLRSGLSLRHEVPNLEHPERLTFHGIPLEMYRDVEMSRVTATLWSGKEERDGSAI